MAVEVVLDTATDSVSVHAAYTAKDISPYVAEGIVHRLEEVMLQLSEDDARERLLSVVLGSRTATPDTEGTVDVDDDLADKGPLDESMVDSLRKTISDFLRIDADLLTVDASLVGLGLDSIRSVGLGRTLRFQGFQLSSVQIMKYSSIRRMINFLTTDKEETKVASGNKSTKVSPFDQELASLQQALDLTSLKLTPNDNVQVYPTTMLQAGMLSQVRVPCKFSSL